MSLTPAPKIFFDQRHERRQLKAIHFKIRWFLVPGIKLKLQQVAI
jgi:hypothetical protein